METESDLIGVKDQIPAPGQAVDLSKRVQLQVMLGKFQRLLDLRIKIDPENHTGKTRASIALWQDMLSEIDEQY